MALPAYNEEVSIGSIVLLTIFYAHNVIVVDDGSSSLTATVTKLIRFAIESVVDIINNGSKEHTFPSPSVSLVRLRFRTKTPKFTF